MDVGCEYSLAGSAATRRRIEPRRAVAAAGGLILAGAVVGALSGAGAGVLAGLLEGADAGGYGFVMFVGAVFGAWLGAIAGPLLGFGPLRRVPLGRGIGVTALSATVVGGASFRVVDLWAPLAGAAAAVIAALALWLVERSSAHRRVVDRA